MLRVTNNGLARARAQAFGQPWKALSRLQEERFFEWRDRSGSGARGVGEQDPAPYLCTADPAARGPRARSHSGRRRWGPCSCGSRTCEACWHWTAGSPPAGTANHRVKAKLLALKLPWEHGEDSLHPGPWPHFLCGLWSPTSPIRDSRPPSPMAHSTQSAPHILALKGCHQRTGWWDQWDPGSRRGRKHITVRTEDMLGGY